jgi:excisionase family DNA binding protein
VSDERASKLADDLLEGAQAAADYIGKPVRSVYHMVREKQIPHFHIGAKLHFRKSELDRHFSAIAA